MRDATLREAKATLRGFFAGQSVEYLTLVVEECRAGTFGFWDQCHCIRGLCDGGYGENYTPGHLAAERALALIGGAEFSPSTTKTYGHGIRQYFHGAMNHVSCDQRVRSVALAILLAEISRRQRQRQPAEVEKESVTA